MNHPHWEIRHYLWKGEPHLALYRDGQRLGYLKADRETATEMARGLGAVLHDLGEVRLTPRIEVKSTASPTGKAS